MHETQSSLGGMALLFWAMQNAPVEKGLDRLVLMVLADYADADGCDACPSKATIASITMHSESAINSSIKRLLGRRLIRYQAGPLSPKLRKIPDHYRPVVYEVLVPYVALGEMHAEKLNETRRSRADWGDEVNSLPLTTENRPKQAPPERTGRKPRSDKGKTNPKRSRHYQPSSEAPQPAPGDSLNPTPGGGGVSQTPGGSFSNRGGGGVSQTWGGVFEKAEGGVSQTHDPVSMTTPQQTKDTRDPVQSDGFGVDGAQPSSSPLDGSAAEGARPSGAVIDQEPTEGFDVADGAGEAQWDAERASGSLPEGSGVSGPALERIAERCGVLEEWGLANDEIELILAGLPKSKTEARFMDVTSDEETARKHARPDKDAPGQREDVDRLCERLADLVEENGYTRPDVTNQWRKSARLLLDKDVKLQKKVDFDGAVRLMDWAMADEFWGARGNIRSMPKFRQQFETLAGQARDEHKKRTNGGSAATGMSRREQSDRAVKDGSTMEMIIDQMFTRGDSRGYGLDRSEADRAGLLDQFFARFYGTRETWSSRVTPERMNTVIGRLAEAGYRIDLDNPTESTRRFRDILQSSMEGSLQETAGEIADESEAEGFGRSLPQGKIMI